MLKYMLDTNIVIYTMKNKPAAVREAFSQNDGQIRADLAGTGLPIGPYDQLIAGHARSLGLVLVTNNTSEFARVEGLRIENWAL